ncbi:hypothetical protein GALMADRAFT_142810 [Galerina marginata CBS 339.88]|uniref:Uncharacterized protein n=1 Tax=Galerina marginata (strain CBS 339.88) TaxID=685588 RepID=A0A067SNM9_GALM3|nr:hypothetical protein GALMADRAFT_142810 [Galerina marginata CBS 339.88]
MAALRVLAINSSKERLSTTFAYNKVVAIDAFNVTELVRNHSAGARSQASSNASTTARETRRKISRAEPCFITKRPSYTLKRAHWVNAVRKDPARKRFIEEFLKKLSLVHRLFDLNDTSNLANRKTFIFIAILLFVDRSDSLPLNVFLVVLNAEIKFRRYKRMASVEPLSADVQELIEQTIKLVDLIYWEPEETAEGYHRLTAGAMRGISRAQPDQQDIDMELGVRTHNEEADEEGFRRPGVDATLEERRDYGRYLISDHDSDLDSDNEELLEELGLVPDCPESPHLGVHTRQEQVNEWLAALQV